MDNTFYWILGLVVAVVCAIFCYRKAEQKGLSGILFGLLGFFLPLIGIIAVLVVPSRSSSTA